MDEGYTVGKHFELVATRWAEHTAIVTDVGAEYTYAELDAEVNAVARGLEKLQVGEGERIALFSPNTPEFVTTYYATLKLGGVVVPISYRASADEVEYLVEASEANVLIYDVATRETVDSFIDDVEATGIGVGLGEYRDLLVDGGPVTPRGARNDLAYIAHTSGSTGMPKLVPHTHDDALLGGLQGAQEVGLRRDDRGLVLAPLFHTAGMYTYFAPHLYTGATSILQKEFDPTATLELIEREEATSVFAVPAQYRAMLRAMDEDTYNTDSLRYIRTGASPMAEQEIILAQETFSENFYNTYGLTECQQNVTIFTPDDPPSKKASIGRASYLWEARVVEAEPPEEVDPEAVVQSPGTGVLLIRGPMTMDGYLDVQEKSEEVIVDGWAYTGDVTEIDAEGYLYIVDRMDNMILSGGENVYPQEVEGVVGGHPAVVDCGVFGVEDEEWGQRVSAAVVVENAIEADELDEYLRESDELANFKRPREYRFVDEIPRSPGSGSIQRGKLPDLESNR